MPTVSEGKIYSVCFELLCAAGALEKHADLVAKHLVGANLVGHDSHGLIRIPQYISAIKEGNLIADAKPIVVRDEAGIAHIDGKGTFGQVVATEATELAIEKARNYGISLVGMGNLEHTGRLGTYTEMAVKEGMAAIMFTSFVGGSSVGVTPFGGRARRLGTNPIAIGFPNESDEPIVLDFATSMAAEGKLRVYRSRNEELPDDWVLNESGEPSKDPNDYYNGGSILPIGGMIGGHKGYALAFMVAMMGPVLGGLTWPDLYGDITAAGSSIVVIDLSKFLPLDELKNRVGDVVRYVKDTPTVKGSKGIMYPGEFESTNREQRQKNGVPIEEPTWESIVQLVDEYGLDTLLS